MAMIALDPSRLADLQMFGADELRKIAGGVIASLEQVQLELTEATAVGDLARAAELAHRGRNEALVIGARELGEALEALEWAARRSEPARVGDALRLLRALWGPTRTAIEGISP
jgi:hypothetical protein